MNLREYDNHMNFNFLMQNFYSHCRLVSILLSVTLNINKFQMCNTNQYCKEGANVIFFK